MVVNRKTISKVASTVVVIVQRWRKPRNDYSIIIFLVTIVMAGKPKNLALSSGQAFNGQRVRRISRPALKIATWNVRSLYMAGKLHNVDSEMTRLDISILGISEVHWPGTGSCNTKNGVMFYSGNNDTAHRHGVGIIVSKKLSASVVNVVPFSDRIIMIQLQSFSEVLNIIQVYAPTADKDENDIEEFYANLEEVLREIKKHQVTVIMGDFNAKVGQGKVDNCVGEFGLGIRNERGDRLIQFCQSESFIVTNTLFKLPKRRLYTWKSPLDSNDTIVRNQIDFILVNDRFRNSILSAKTYPGADVGSDHNPVVACLRVKLKLLRKSKPNLIDITKLKKENIQKIVTEQINRNIEQVKHENIDLNIELNTVNEKWKSIKNSILTVSKEHLKPERKRHKSWMTEEILQMMDERRTFKAKDQHKYREIHRRIKYKIREAKENWISDQCKDIEELERKYDTFNMHKRIKEITNKNKRKSMSLLKDSRGRLVINAKDKLECWTKYIKDLFKDEERTNVLIIDKDTGPMITRNEVDYAIQHSKSGKASGPDEIPGELLKLLDDDARNTLLELYNLVYSTGQIPDEWLLSTFVPIPKKVNAKECSEYRTIALMSHALKILLKVIHNRIYKKLEVEVSHTQMGFRNGLGTREALFSLNIMLQRCIEMNQDVYACFIDFEKAFDKVQHTKMIQILKNKSIDGKDIQLITNLYFNQKAKLLFDTEITEEIEICRGVRQGCILSPLLFNAYSEQICQESLQEINKGIVVNGEVINNIRYADDTVVVAENIEDLHNLVESLNNTCNEYGIKINLKKTKFMIISKLPQYGESLIINNTQIERVSYYKYLGTWIAENCEQTKEIRSRIEIARSNFNSMRKVFCSRDLNTQLKIRMLHCYVFSTLLYGAEAWTLKQGTMKKLEAFEMWCYRRVLRISWIDRIKNATVLQRLNTTCKIINTIKTRKLQYFGHIMRGNRYKLLRLIIQGKINGRRSRGRRRISWMDNLRNWFNCSAHQLFKAAMKKDDLAMMISNLR